ncbi:tRNA lysidine(34) synthetase TilS [Palleronia pelagia]|uniref:tRNA(Ile)-lysidine synthase n=1 Tax=Palleronia pelagia TaxID=387096 RepID=A0A1H8JBK9_9RHOB|nr:tRNA lysidine(34) synthetase TilS [Palleronia pelagia]SEN78293.1 tRNA(Ile)-lysidine synthase [Palleronia pelagia]
MALEGLRQRLTDLPQGRFGVAVSGGSDSMALLHVAAETLGPARLCAVTVDHRLRPEAADEARTVARVAAGLGVSQDILSWTDGPSARETSGNLSERAREARYRLMADWARERRLIGVLLGHTADDVAETFVMRLGRRAGLKGLAAMAPVTHFHGVPFHRPALDERRAALRDHLSAAGLHWIEDPSNHDLRYDRARARHALRHLSAAGLDPDDIAAAATHLRAAEIGLQHLLSDWATRHARTHRGATLIDAPALFDLPSDPTLRVLGGALRHVTGAAHPPRAADLSRLLAALRSGDTRATLHGCLVTRDRTGIAVLREPAMAEASVPVPLGATWDDRWIVTGPGESGMSVKAVGAAGLSQLGNWREAGLPRAQAMSGPGVWRGETLIAAPELLPDGPFAAKFARDDFPAWLASH